jgi:flagellar biosynthesis protein FlhG
MAGALKLVRRALGRDAVILETRGAKPGADPSAGVTVVAAVDRHSEVAARAPQTTEECPGAGTDVAAGGESGEGPGIDPFGPRRAKQHLGSHALGASIRTPVSVAVTSGKGGVGKTSLVTNLAILLGGMGRRVLLVDGDFGLANVDLLLGLTPDSNLYDVVRGRKRIGEIVMSGPAGIRVLPAASGVAEMADIDDYRYELLIQSFETVTSDCDALLIDTSSGIHRRNLRLAQMADEILVVTTPEPPAFSDAYATIKVLCDQRPTCRPSLVLNRVSDETEAMLVAEKVRRVTRQFLGFAPELLGVIPEDEAVPRAIRAQKPLVTAFPNSPASAAVRALARRIIERSNEPGSARQVPDRAHSWSRAA